MKSLIKKLKSCRYSDAAATPSRDEPFHTTRHHCGHPVMKSEWKIEQCEACRYYEAIPKPPQVRVLKK